jgi:Nif-specific regulatory protein
MRSEPSAPQLTEGSEQSQVKNQVEIEEVEAIESALKKTKGVQIKAADMLGISLRQLRYRIRKYNIVVRKINLVD